MVTQEELMEILKKSMNKEITKLLKDTDKYMRKHAKQGCNCTTWTLARDNIVMPFVEALRQTYPDLDITIGKTRHTSDWTRPPQYTVTIRWAEKSHILTTAQAMRYAEKATAAALAEAEEDKKKEDKT